MAKSETDQQLAARGLDRWGFPLPGGPRAPVPLQLTPEAPTAPQARRQGGRGSFTDAKLLPALRELCAAANGRRLGRSEIARRCGVDKETIRGIEVQAVRKLRARLGAAHLKSIREILAASAER